MPPAVPPQLAHDWARIQSELRRAVDQTTFDVWLAPLRVHGLADGTLLVSAPEQIRAWVADRFGALLDTSARAVLGPDARVRLTGPGAPAAPAAAEESGPTQDFNPKLTFDQFVIGDSNRFAHAAALAVAELPGQTYNPLFLYGPPGVGKTHLLHSIGNYVEAFGAGLSVRYTTAERFTNEFVTALRANAMGTFKSRFRHNDVLLIDDVQFLQNKAKTEDEFFHTFNALYDTGSQLVITCDRMPGDIAALEDRLRERFAAGLVADIGPPDLGTRMAILRKRVQLDGIDLADDAVLRLIAQRITVNARALEGALVRVVAFHSLTCRPLDAALADEVLSGLYPHARDVRPAITIDRVQELACEAFGVSRDDLLSPRRTALVAWARQVAMYLSRKHTSTTLPAIGERFGGRNHTTVLHACRRAEQRIAEDPACAAAVHELEDRLTHAG